jgi:RNA polymerase sigma-70 factor (subfamily 1)
MSPLDDGTTREMLRAALAGDGEAWSRVVVTYSLQLLRLARLRLDPRLQSRVDPEDVVQEALFDASQKLESFFEGALPLSVWLRQRVIDHVHRIHRDHFVTHKRDPRREQVCERPSQLGADPGTSPSKRSVRFEDGGLVRDIFQELSDCDREILGLVFYERCAHREIADLLGLSSETVRQRLCRALGRINSELLRKYPEWYHASQRCT